MSQLTVESLLSSLGKLLGMNNDLMWMRHTVCFCRSTEGSMSTDTCRFSPSSALVCSLVEFLLLKLERHDWHYRAVMQSSKTCSLTSMNVSAQTLERTVRMTLRPLCSSPTLHCSCQHSTVLHVYRGTEQAQHIPVNHSPSFLSLLMTNYCPHNSNLNKKNHARIFLLHDAFAYMCFTFLSLIKSFPFVNFTVKR